jgi:Fe2+ transport system protein FeoA
MRSDFSASRFSENTPLSRLQVGDEGIVACVVPDERGRADRLAALGVTPGARIVVRQTFPGLVFECDQTELAVERIVGGAIMVDTTIHYEQIVYARREP